MRTLEAAARRLKLAGPGTPAGGRVTGRLRWPWRLPGLWLLSDPRRLPDPRAAAARLPPGAAVVARDLAPAVLAGLAAVARRRRLLLLVAGEGRLALRHGAGLLLPDRRPTTGLPAFLAARRRHRLVLLAAAHGRAGLARARRLGADAVLLSPVFPTASHPGAPALGPLRWAALAARGGRPAVALGGVAGGNAGRLPARTAGLAAIGGFA
ncbi:hypothetical protein GCM10011504_02600 [Siccirubricoccus deserti]|uniref:thiamine phosphate synthase n=1 Tax=Siccirubricoccus deserti TaxID=2013562 RepID=UPI00199533D6|nr:thiamine phosphate synthase [Siccirubricoccus deserti]GGC27904.1 hypothetical protein GCM10011504_02600 [Siccirubricoccus deserti]